MNSNFKFADLPVSIIHNYSMLEELCNEYKNDQNSGIVLSINEGDIKFEKRKFDFIYPNHVSKFETDEYFEFVALQRKISEVFPLYNRALFHGSALAIDNNGIIFTAKSGTGKSTHSRLWREAFNDRVIMINDDKPFLHVEKDRTVVFGSPWDGKHHLSSNASFPLKAICILSRSETNNIKQIGKEEAYSILYQQTYKPENLEAMKRTLFLIDQLMRNVRVYLLYCNMEIEAAEVAYNGLKEVLYETE